MAMLAACTPNPLGSRHGRKTVQRKGPKDKDGIWLVEFYAPVWPLQSVKARVHQGAKAQG